MSLIDRDVILHQLRFLQQLLARAKKAALAQDFATALDEIHGGYREALGIPHDLLSRLDVGSALLMLRTPEKQSAYVELLRAEAEIRHAPKDALAARPIDERLAEVERHLATSPPPTR